MLKGAVIGPGYFSHLKNLEKKKKKHFQPKFGCSYFQTGVPLLMERQGGGINVPIFCSPPMLFIHNSCQKINDKPNDLLIILSKQQHLLHSGLKESLHNNKCASI